MSAHTPGPYQAATDAFGHRYAWIETASDGTPIARVATARDELDGFMAGYIPNRDRIDEDPQALANARLIAAAPDLLAACEGLVELLGGPYDADTFAVQYLAAQLSIARAYGEVTP